ncbi:mediator of RNA polymerase II transcription subunit 25 isoform X2 [Lepeophtheirus salmonis]|uniref:mediator of RNA polymerase II transcription subunit 25 isoform X2 n=1 Tax=Lepeophtheirus salmonis TaxID=72036 RepID=UPI001AE3048D|nr:mediator of RNA polymerase II transcription subunit 25-like isoform X2 [Lepeophtheirus salmonis]
MVLLDGGHLRDVVLVVEDTALNGAYMEEEMKGNYLIPSLEYLSRGREEEWGDVARCSSYHLVTFAAADSHPRSTTRVKGPFISYSSAIAALDQLSWSGGCGETHSCGVEGIAAALRVFDRLDNKRRAAHHNHVDPSSKYVIYLANSPYYDVPVRVNTPPYVGKRMEELLPLFLERSIHLTLLSPRKLPTLVRMFKMAGGDLMLYKEKNYAQDPRHLVLLGGIQLQETPLVVISTPQQQQTQQQPQPQPQTIMTQAQQPFPVQQPQPQQVMQRAPLRPQQIHMPQQQQIRLQQQNQRMQQQRLLSAGGTVVAPQQAQQGTPRPTWQQQQQANTSNILRDRLKQQQLQQAQQQQQAAQQQQQAAQQQTDNPTLKTLLNHPPQPVVNQTATGPIIMNPQQQMNNPRMPGGNLSTLQQQLSRPPNVTIAGTMNQINPQQTVAQPQQPQPQQTIGQNRPRETIWEGELTWRDSIKIDIGSQDYKSHSVVCSVTTAVNEEGVPDVKSNSWPKKLIMQVIPKALVQNIGGHYFRNARSVFFHPEQCESLIALTRSLGSGYAGCVHFTGSPNCDIKVLILLYSSEKGAYLGFIPNEQYRFVERVRKIIQQERTEQQIMANRLGAGGAGPSTVPVSMAQVRPGVPVSQNQQQTITIQNPQQQQPGMQMATTTMSVAGSTMNIQAGGGGGGTGVMPGGHMGQVLPQQQGAMGSVEIIQSLEQELQRQKNFYRQQQQQQQHQIQTVRPDGAQLMQQQQQQQRMPGQNNIRQMLNQPHFQQRATTMPQQHLFMQPVMTGTQATIQQQPQQQQQNDPMLRELLG